MDKDVLISKYNVIKLASKLQQFKKKTGYVIQSLLFSKAKFNVKSAKQWAVDNGYKDSKLLITDENIRLRQKQPKRFNIFKTISIAEGIQAVIASKASSKFVGTMRLVNFSKFSELKSDLDITIPMMAEIEFLCEGQTRDGFIRREDIEESLELWDGIPIIDFHDMTDMKRPTEHKIRDRAGYLEKPKLKIKDGKMWISGLVSIIDRNLAYHLYIKEKSNKPLQVSPEFRSIAYNENGVKYQTNIKPYVISIVDRGHIQGNKLSILS